ncbi:hypothetical protein HPP92_008488 [Vanilla planifolia]|uniref:PRLI-interacting factor A n=1 Tax=Vanilla planifolia TaxID=51239 RepID=A0A835R8X8_VANPL|nr:hypothetical protein HPP92_008488 [Vanilla planifolia]
MNDPSQILSRKYGMWQLQPQPQVAVPPPPTLAVAEEPIGFANPRPVFTPQGNLPGRISWKNKKAAEKRKKAAAMAPGTVPVSGPGVGVSGYKPPTLNELQFKNRMKARRFYPKKKFNRFAPFAPRNTTSFIIRAKKSGGIASLVSPCPVTPAILPTPTFSPLREQFVDMAKEEWGVDGYGSMKGLIRLRSPIAGSSRVGGGGDDEDDYDDDGSSESEVEEHGEVERKLDVSQFEMVCPNFGEDHGWVAAATAYLLESRVDDQDAHIARLEEENLTLKERLFLMEREMGELRRRLLLLETDYRTHNEKNDNNNNNNSSNKVDEEDNNNKKNVEENAIPVTKEEASENDGGGDVCSEKSIGEHEESSDVPMHED